MFGKKAKKIKELKAYSDELYKNWREAYRDSAAAQIQVANLKAQLQHSEELNQVLSEENRDRFIRLELLQDVLKQLNIPVKLKK
jgi:hypothetical protein